MYSSYSELTYFLGSTAYKMTLTLLKQVNLTGQPANKVNKKEHHIISQLMF